ncbi:MAG: HDOD domain-containing protein, partial [Chitinivibrionales bacterium]|nr:HDOD domain-containing protein [Chitinivibrionales bacterium]MBD3358732.1 HDOD domain-containing protein [Chitinivibrionales bacterium]
MITLMMMTENSRETQILKMAFEQSHIKPLLTKPTYSNYIKALQYAPDVILMEMPKINSEQLHFARLIKQHRKTKHIPVIAYGDQTDPALKRGMHRSGVENFLERPLKFSQLIKVISMRLKQQNKSIELSAGKCRVEEKEQDIALILDPDTLATKKIELIVKHICGLMAFPFTVAKVLQITGSSKGGAADLAKEIEADPVIATNILKVSNSVFFASANRRINSIRDAIVRIGFRETKRIVMGMAVMELFDDESNSAGYDRIDYWYHSLATGLFAERIARRLGRVNAEEAFLGGLLHDFGLLLFDEFFPTVFEKILALTTDRGTSFNDAAINLLGISHTDIVAELFEIWKIPSSLSEAITSQYSICDERKSLDTPGKRMALCIALGNLMAKSYRFGALCDQYVIALDAWVYREAKMSGGPGKALVDGVRQEIQMYR